jgi:four helix bundle protein
MKRAAVSIMANIAEGFERGKPREYLHFLTIAKASCAEVRSHLYVALDIGYLDQVTFDNLSERTDEIARIIRSLTVTIRQTHGLS